MQTVVFDLGNVLLDWAPRRLYRNLIDDPDRARPLPHRGLQPAVALPAGQRPVDRRRDG